MRLINFTIGILVGLLVGCASTIGDSVLQFKDREFIVHPDKPAMAFPYNAEVCVPRTGLGRILGDRCTTTWTEDVYDMNDKPTREKFIAAGCTMKCAGRFK